ncbi:MAG: J domain-containing protein [Deltaproteobacteria bacterium]|nr:J domain-containing protein [Deltaproteobacteria bacterium]
MKMTRRREAALRAQVHLVDQRRILYLRCGTIDQGRIGRIPGRLIASLADKSRDEIEQYLLTLERSLPRSEYKLYVYTTLDLQRFFPDFMAKKLPEGLDQNSLDEHFEQEICRLHGDRVFWAGEAIGNVLHEYLVRYVIMFFDSEFAGSTLLEDYVKDFINRHRARRSPRTQSAVTFEQASTIFGIKKEALRTMTTRGLTRLYRRMAKKLHPDTGGSHEAFVELTEAYHALLRQKKPMGR